MFAERTDGKTQVHEQPRPPEIVDESTYAPDQIKRLNLEAFTCDFQDWLPELALEPQECEGIIQLLTRFPLTFRQALIDLIKQWNPADRRARYSNPESFESGEFVILSGGDPICRIEQLHYSYPTVTLYGKKESQSDDRPLLAIHTATVYQMLAHNLLSNKLYTVYFATR